MGTLFNSTLPILEESCYNKCENKENNSMSDFPGKGKVAVLKTSPETILEDIQRLMTLAGL